MCYNKKVKLRWPFLILTLLGGLLWPLFEAWAQPGADLGLTAPLLEDFPRLTFYAAVRDAQGQPIHDLPLHAFALQEDDRPVALTEVTETHPGVQVVLAITPGPPLGVRDVLGVSRYEYVYLQWQSWIQSHTETAHYDLSLTTGEGAYLRHSADFDQLDQALAAYKPAFRQSEPSLGPLDTALQLAGDPTPRPGMGRAVLWLTPPLPEDLLDALPQYIQRARAAQVRVFVWLVAAPEQFETPVAQALQNLAQATGGAFTAFSGTETLPVLDDLFEPLGYAYRLTYLSRVREGENHTLTLQVTLPSGDTVSASQAFTLRILPPNPALVDPPAQIVRVYPPDTSDPARLTPARQPLSVSVDFPDGYPRALKAVRLLVDGHVVAQRDEPPFTQLTWDLQPYTTSGPHSVVVEAEDILGLVGRSADLRVQITVPKPRPLAGAVHRYGTYVTWAALALAGVLLLLVILGPSRPRHALAESALPHLRNLSHWAQNLARRQAVSQRRAHAYLLPLPDEEDDDAQPTTPVLTLYTDEALIGSDPAQATLLLRDPSVSPVHARLWRDEHGQIFLADRESLAGTWVNYAPVSPYGTRLEEGDIVHIGRVRFRFHLPGEAEPAPVVIPLSQDAQGSPEP